ncbi:hypothetical protein JCM8208_002035 [Rhodotorula glutinis]
MDHDIDTLHGIASAHSDSGYASTQYSAQPLGPADAPRHPGPASLNSRLDRLTRQMSSLAHSSPQDAGASIGITRKTIARTVHSASEASTRATRPRRRRLDEQEGDDAHEQPMAKRRRSLPPRLTLRPSSTGEGSAVGHTASGYSAPVVLNRVVSPRSGATRIVTGATAQPHYVETLEGTMQIPSFLREQQDPPQLPASPPPDWLSSRLVASSRAHDHGPARAPPQAPSSTALHQLDFFAPDLAHDEQYDHYEPVFDSLRLSSSPRPSGSTWVALPFSTDGRLAPTASLASSPPRRPRPPDSLYESQMHRDYHFLDSTPPSQHEMRPPVVGPPFSQPHLSAFPHDSPRVEPPSAPRTIFGQPIADLAQLDVVPHPAPRRYFPSSSPPPYPLALAPLSPPLSPAPSALDTLLNELDAPMSSADFWRPRTRPPGLLAPSPTPGRARYAALLERTAAQQVQHVEAPKSTAHDRPHPDEHEPGPAADAYAMQLDRPPRATSNRSPPRLAPANPDRALAPHGPPPFLAPITSFAAPLARAHAPLRTHARSPTPTPTPARVDWAVLRGRDGEGEKRDEEEEQEDGAVGRAARGEGGSGGAEGGQRRGEGEGSGAGERGGGAGRAREEQDGWAIWEDEDEVEEV